MGAQLKRFPKSLAVREVNTVQIAERPDMLAIKADAISLAVHGVMEIARVPSPSRSRCLPTNFVLICATSAMTFIQTQAVAHEAAQPPFRHRRQCCGCDGHPCCRTL